MRIGVSTDELGSMLGGSPIMRDDTAIVGGSKGILSAVANPTNCQRGHDWKPKRPWIPAPTSEYFLTFEIIQHYEA